MIILVYYNPNQYHFYLKCVSTIPEDVGYVNSYDHILVQMLKYSNGHLRNVQSYFTLFPEKKETAKVRFINRLIRFLNKLKG